MAKIGWLVTGGLTLVTAIVLMFVMNENRGGVSSRHGGWSLDDFLADIKKVDLQNEDSIKAAKDKITKSKLWKNSRIQEEVKQWLDKLNGAMCSFRAPEVTRRYLEALRTAANAATSATTGEGLAPYGPLEDTIRLMLQEAMANKDAEAEAFYQRLWNEICSEINAIVAKLFSEAYQNRVTWTNLLTDTAGWTPAASSSFKHTFGTGLTLINEPGEHSAPGGLSYTPADKWRDYVLEVELKLDSGALVFYTRIGDKMDLKETPGFTVGTENTSIPIESGKVYNLVISTIGNRLTVTGEGISPYAGDIEPTKARKGEPGIVAQAGTTATITKLRARHLR